VAMPARTASSVAWKADGQELAITEVTNGRSQVVVLRAADWQGRTLSEGSDPKWSASGARIAFARGATIVIADVASGRDLASITPAAPGYGWNGDTLLYWGGTSLRGWRDGADARFGAHVPDLTPLTGQKVFSFSADGSRYAVAGNGKVLYGGTLDGRLSPLPTFDRVSWSTGGANVLLTGNRVTALIRPEKRIFAGPALPPRFALWSPDGSQALFGSDPTGADWDVIAWDGQKMGATVGLASGLKSGAFSFDGGYLASIYDDGLRIYRCGRDSATSSGLITRDQAKQVIARSGALIKVNLEDSKLVRWADISGMLTGSWAVVQPEASGIDPSAPVWLLMYAGEAKQPAGSNFESSPGVRSPTVNLVLYVLDAKTGKELGARVASGTWWIGQPFESLTDRAPDPTPHPFEQPHPSIPPIPTPRPTPSPATSSAGAGMARVESAAGGWRMDFPDGWWPSRNGFAGILLSTRDPDLGLAGPTSGLESWYLSGAGVTVELWANPDRLSAEAWSTGNLGGTLVTRNSESSPVTVAGKAALLLRRSVGPQPPDNHFDSQKVWVVPAERPDRMLVITAQLGDGVYAAEMDAAVTSLALFAPQSAATSVDISRDDVLGRWSASPRPGRVEAKLVTWAEAGTLEKSTIWNRLDRDPDSLVWIVAVSAAGAEPGFSLPRGGGRLGGGQPDPPRWLLSVTPSNSADDGAGMWGQASTFGDWPDGFDALKDRCC
jgi:hypothetical protein